MPMELKFQVAETPVSWGETGVSSQQPDSPTIAIDSTPPQG